MPREKDFNDYEIRGDITAIIIINKKGERFEGLIDTKNLQKLIDLNYVWHVRWNKDSKSYYVRTMYRYGEPGNRKGKVVYLHSLLLNAPPKVKVDHINHDSLDNTEKNIRIVESANNSANRKGANKNSGTGVRNVNYGRNREEYWVQFCKNGVKYKWDFPLSQFAEACKFADIKRKEIFGEFAGSA